MRRLCCLLAAICLMSFASSASAAYGKMPEDIFPQEITREELRQRAADFIDEMIRASGDTRRYTVELVHIPRSVRAPEGAVSFAPSMPYGLRFWGNTAVYMDILVDGAPFRQVKCQFKIHVFDRIAVAARPLAPGQPLTESDFRFEEQELGSRGKNFLTDGNEIVGKTLSRPLAIGTPILRSMLKTPDLLKAGAPVTLISRLNGVEVKMDGIALEAGGAGKIIRVRNNASRKVLRGRIIDEFTVEIVHK